MRPFPDARKYCVHINLPGQRGTIGSVPGLPGLPVSSPQSLTGKKAAPTLHHRAGAVLLGCVGSADDCVDLRGYEQAGRRPRSPQGLRRCRRRGGLVCSNDPEGVAIRGNRASSLNRRALLLRAVLDVLDVFFSQIQQPPGGRGIGDLTGQPPALIDLLDECRM